MFDRQSSLHGYAYRYMWELVDLQESHVTLSWRSPDIAGYPFDITITATYALDENGLTETFTVHNNDSVKAPWGIWHPPRGWPTAKHAHRSGHYRRTTSPAVLSCTATPT